MVSCFYVKHCKFAGLLKNDYMRLEKPSLFINEDFPCYKPQNLLAKTPAFSCTRKQLDIIYTNSLLGFFAFISTVY